MRAESPTSVAARDEPLRADHVRLRHATPICCAEDARDAILERELGDQPDHVALDADGVSADFVRV